MRICNLGFTPAIICSYYHYSVLYVVRSVLVYSNRARSSALPGYIRFEECVVCEWTEAQLVPALRRKAN